MRLPIDILTGSENYDGKTASLQAYWCPKSEDIGLKETILDMAAQYKHGNISRSNAEKGPAFRGLKTLCGEWTSARFMIPEGQIIKFFAKRSIKGNIEVMASMYIQIRDKAALRERRLKLTAQDRSLNLFAYIRGNYDVLTVDQVAAAGVVIPRHFIQFADSGMVAKAFDEHILEPEKESIRDVEMTAITTIANAKNTNQVIIAKPVIKIGRR